MENIINDLRQKWHRLLPLNYGVKKSIIIQGCEKQGKSRQWVQQEVWCWSGCSSDRALFLSGYSSSLLEVLSREFDTGCPWELLYADDLMISAESI